MKKIKTTLKYIVVCLLVALSLVGCVIGQNTANDTTTAAIEAQDITENPDARDKDSQPDAQSENGLPRAIQTGTPVSLADIPAYDGTSYIQLENNMPDFTEEEKKSTEAFERYSDLDSLGRCGQAYANICPELQPTEERGTIGNVRPSGWHTVKYNDLIDGNYLYNRCHLIAYCLAGENANEKNLITGTRYLNVQGMLPFENLTADYVKETGNHVLYRVTPIFEGDNLLASGVLMEAESVEDDGDGVLFCVYVYNVQPGVAIDYATGDNWLAEDGGAGSAAAAGSGNSSASENGANTSSGGKNTSAGSSGSTVSKTSDSESGTYILNTKTMKFHRPDCTSVEKIKAENKEEYTGKRSKLIEEGYEACKSCKP